MYVLQDLIAFNPMRIMKAVKGEGMPTYKNPFVHGNLFLILNIQFPDSLDIGKQGQLRQLLPPPLNTTTGRSDEEHVVTDIDPVASYNANKVNMQAGGEAYDEDDEGGGGGGPGGGGVQCQQM